MKNTILALFVSLCSASALADGFVCLTEEQNLKLTVYNKVNPTDGTRSPSVMVVSNPQHKIGNKTIARFNAESGTLVSDHLKTGGLLFEGLVDLRYNDVARKGEYLMGTRLGELSSLYLAIDFRYGDNLIDGEYVSGKIIALKRNGKTITAQAHCERYLKAE